MPSDTHPLKYPGQTPRPGAPFSSLKHNNQVFSATTGKVLLYIQLLPSLLLHSLCRAVFSQYDRCYIFQPCPLTAISASLLPTLGILHTLERVIFLKNHARDFRNTITADWVHVDEENKENVQIRLDVRATYFSQGEQRWLLGGGDACAEL